MPKPATETPPVALFWDASLVWGLIARETLAALGLPHRVVTARDVRAGALGGHRVLMVPGGWAAEKVAALGEAGSGAVSRFVERGGSYLGFCGGAGLALSGAGSLGLLPLARLAGGLRLPNASGGVILRRAAPHPAFQGLPERLSVSILWPGQFGNCDGVEVLARYEAPGEDFRLADIEIGEARAAGGWKHLEAAYGIPLDPARLMGEPAIIEGRRGLGRVLLSYPHLEVPGEPDGNRLLARLIASLDEAAARHGLPVAALAPPKPRPLPRPDAPSAVSALAGAREAAGALIEEGRREGLWEWRRPWLLSWRRGLRGLEYGTLAVSLSALCKALRLDPSRAPAAPEAEALLRETREFCDLARRLLSAEKTAMNGGPLPKLGPVSPEVDTLRAHLFGTRMRHGGLCASLFSRLDGILGAAVTE